jgi:hypothetical protein
MRLPDPAAYFEREELPLKGPGKWKTGPCPFHGGSDSLRVNTERGGWVCMSCGAKGGDLLSFHMLRYGLPFVDACKALGAWTEDGRPHPARLAPLPFSARAALEVCRFEVLLVAVAACNLARGIELASGDRDRLVKAAGRLQFIAQEIDK